MEQEVCERKCVNGLVLDSKVSPRVGTILMIHGWSQNAKTMHFWTKSLADELNEKGFRVVYPEAPHILPENEVNGRENARAWYLFDQERPSDARRCHAETPVPYFGLQEALDVLECHMADFVREKETGNGRHIGACLGFSQGASILHIMAAHANGGHKGFSGIQKVIFAGGFCAMHDAYDHDFFLSSIGIDSLHCIGLKDNRVIPRKQHQLARRFTKARIFEHEKGHIVPQHRSFCKEIIDFLMQ